MVFHKQVAAFATQLSDTCALAGEAMEGATQALLQADLVLAEHVITQNDKIATMSSDTEEAALALLARQAPVAGDLRVVVCSLRNTADVERMGNTPYPNKSRIPRRNGPHRRASRNQHR